VSLNPRSRLAAILRFIDAALHPVRTFRAARARRIAYDLYVPRHARQELYVLPDALISDTEYLTATPDPYGPAPSNYTRTDEMPLLSLDELFPLRGEIHVLGEELLDLHDGSPVIGGYVGVAGERVAA
jgi:hypothetical protein